MHVVIRSGAQLERDHGPAPRRVGALVEFSLPTARRRCRAAHRLPASKTDEVLQVGVLAVRAHANRKRVVCVKGATAVVVMSDAVQARAHRCGRGHRGRVARGQDGGSRRRLKRANSAVGLQMQLQSSRRGTTLVTSAGTGGAGPSPPVVPSIIHAMTHANT